MTPEHVPTFLNSHRVWSSSMTITRTPLVDRPIVRRRGDGVAPVRTDAAAGQAQDDGPTAACERRT